MDELQPVLAGQPIQFKAKTWNAFISAANDYAQRSGTRFSGGELRGVFNGSVIAAKNTGSTDIKPFTGVSITAPLIDPSLSDENVRKFKTRQVVKCQQTTTSEPGPVAIAYDVIKAGRVGRVVVSGAIFCKVDIETIYDDVCVAGDTAGQLKGATHGRTGPRILCKPPGDKLGIQWCIVEVGEVRARFASVYRVQLAADLLATDASVSVDSFINYNGLKLPNYTSSHTETAFNPFGLSGANNAAALIQWCESLERWEITMVGCV